MAESKGPTGYKRLELTRGAEPVTGGSVWPMLLEPVVAKRRQIAWAVLASVVVAVCVFSLLPNRYMSTARILPESRQSGFSGVLSRYSAGILESAGLGGRALSEDESALYVEILKSDYVKDDVLEHFYDIPKARPVPLTLYDYLKVEVREQAYEKLGELVQMSKDNRTGIVTVTAETTQPELSAQVATQMVSALARYNATQRKTALAEVERFLAEKLEGSADELHESEEALAQFQSRNRNYVGADDPELARDLGRLERDLELKTATYMTLNQQYLLARIEAQKEVPSFQFLDRPRPATTKSGPHRIRGTLAAAFATALLLVGSLVSLRWLKLVLGPGDAVILKSMASEVTGDVAWVLNRVKHLSHHARS